MRVIDQVLCSNCLSDSTEILPAKNGTTIARRSSVPSRYAARKFRLNNYKRWLIIQPSTDGATIWKWNHSHSHYYNYYDEAGSAFGAIFRHCQSITNMATLSHATSPRTL